MKNSSKSTKQTRDSESRSDLSVQKNVNAAATGSESVGRKADAPFKHDSSLEKGKSSSKKSS